jgi:hypothetical protein
MMLLGRYWWYSARTFFTNPLLVLLTDVEPLTLRLASLLLLGDEDDVAVVQRGT